MSKQLQIEVIQVGDAQFMPTPRGGYNQIEVAYKSGGKVEGKVIRDFVNKDVYAQVKGLRVGDRVTVTMDKVAGNDGKEYWQWLGISAGEAPEGPAVSQGNGTSASVASKPTGKVTGSNYETAEERAARQVYIVRQSGITAALSLHAAQGTKPSVDSVIATAERFKDFVFNGLPVKAAPVTGPKKAAKPAVEVEDNPFDDMDDDIPA